MLPSNLFLLIKSINLLIFQEIILLNMCFIFTQDVRSNSLPTADIFKDTNKNAKAVSYDIFNDMQIYLCPISYF